MTWRDWRGNWLLRGKIVARGKIDYLIVTQCSEGFVHLKGTGLRDVKSIFQLPTALTNHRRYGRWLPTLLIR